jgi:hypothetical protein
MQPKFGGMVLGWSPSKIVQWSQFPTNMAAKLNIEKRGNEIKKNKIKQCHLQRLYVCLFISRYTNIDKFVNIQYIFLLLRRAYSWLFQLAQMWKLLAPGIRLTTEKKIFRNRPIRNKNGLWWPCLLTDRDEMSNLYRGPSTDASYQVLIHLARLEL